MLHEPTARPYLIRAVYDWCNDLGYTPYIAVYVDQSVGVPRAYVQNNQITLNISPDATNNLVIDDQFIEFVARFSGKSHRVLVPVSHVLAIYARENQEGLQFPVNPADFDESPVDDPEGELDSAEKEITGKTALTPSKTQEDQKKSTNPLTRPYLHRVK